MNILQLITETQTYQILNIERDVAPAHNSHKQGMINISYADLVNLFGRPDNFVDNDRADINYEWDLIIKYKDPINDEHQKNKEEFDSIEVAIYDYRHNEQERYEDPSTITHWTVGSKNKEGLWVLLDYLDK